MISKKNHDKGLLKIWMKVNEDLKLFVFFPWKTRTKVVTLHANTIHQQQKLIIETNKSLECLPAKEK